VAKILLVEDNELNRDLISRRLKRRGFEVSVALDGAEGIARAQAEHPDLILMDMGLPVLSGYDAARRLKELETTRDIPIVGLSARAMAGDADKARRAGCDEYDTKPIEWPRLLAKITALLERSAHHRPGVSTTGVAPSPSPAAGPGGRNVLVVATGGMSRETLRRRLLALGDRVAVAESGRQALQRLAESPADVVLLQVELPDMSGADVLRFIRSQPALRDLPVLMIAGIDEREQALACLELGARDVLSPPFPPPLVNARLTAATAAHLRSGAGGEEREELFAEHLRRCLLPGFAVAELAASGRVLPRRLADAGVLVLLLEDLAARCDQGVAEAAIAPLQELVVACEEIEARHPLARIKPLPEGLLFAVGLDPELDDPAPLAVHCALEVLATSQRLLRDWPLRLGLHDGPVVAALVGRKRLHFDLWGSTVDVARTVARHGAPGALNVSGAVWQRLGPTAIGERVTTVEGRRGGDPDGSRLGIYRLDHLDPLA